MFTCLAYELEKVGLEVERQKVIPLQYDELTFETGFRIDLLINRTTVVEIKAVSALAEIHKAQLLSYLRLGGYAVGLLINFNVPMLKDGLCRLSN